MNKSKKSLYDMAMTVTGFVAANASAFSPGAVAINTRLTGLLTTFRDKNLLAGQYRFTKGLVAQKEALKATAALQGSAIAAAMVALYTASGNLDASTRLKNYNTPSKIRKSNLAGAVQSNVITFVENLKEVQTAATAQAVLLASTYGINAAALTAFGASITALDAVKVSVRTSIANGVAIGTNDLKKLSDDIRAVLVELDNATLIISTVPATQSLYNQYKNARNIVLPSGFRTKLLVRLVDADGVAVLDADVFAKSRNGRNPKTGAPIAIAMKQQIDGGLAILGNYELNPGFRGFVDVYVGENLIATYFNAIGKVTDLGDVTVADVATARIGGNGMCWPSWPTKGASHRGGPVYTKPEDMYTDFDVFDPLNKPLPKRTVIFHVNPATGAMKQKPITSIDGAKPVSGAEAVKNVY